MTLDHKTSHKGQFVFNLKIYTSPESWINKRSIDLWFVGIGQHLNETTIFYNEKYNFDVFMVGTLQNIFMEHDLYLGPVLLNSAN